jgi:hypothetical protein
MADYNPNTVSAYQQYASSMSSGGGGSNMSGLGAKSSSSGKMSSRFDTKGYTPTKSTSTASGAKYVTEYGGDEANIPMTPEQIYAAAANATTEVGGFLVPTIDAPMIHAANLYSMPNMVQQVSDYVYRADRDMAVREAISGVQQEEQDSVDAAIKSINKAITQGKTDAEIAEAFLNDMAGMGSDKPDESGGFGVPGVTLKDVTDTQQGLMTNPQPLYDFAEEMANPSITTTELPSITADQKEKLGAKLREASDKGDLSSVMNQLAQDSKVQLSSAVTNFIEGAETQVASNDIDPFTGLPVGNNELGFTDVSPSAEAAEQQGLMARSRVPTGSIEEAVREVYGLEEEPAPEAETPAVAEETTTTTNTFSSSIAEFETDHGDVPVPTNDASEANLPEAQRSKDVGYGHKVKPSEEASGMIHGVRFKDDQGNYIPLTEAQKQTILEGDMDANVDLARSDTEGGIGWDTKLANINSSWDALDSDYKDVLTSLAFNVGGENAGRSWTAVLTAARDENVTDFANHIRRKDAGRYTAGMDNRAVKELYAAGLITGRSEVQTQLPLADQRSGVPR